MCVNEWEQSKRQVITLHPQLGNREKWMLKSMFTMSFY